MSDLVERLRMADQETPYLFDLIFGAADEIVRLQKLVEEMTELVERARNLVPDWSRNWHHDASKALSNKEETK